MSTLRDIAQLIPPEYRREILELNMLQKAQAIRSDPTMNYLGVIYKNYIDPGFSGDCPLCYSRVLDHFRAMRTIFIELENERKLLDEV